MNKNPFKFSENRVNISTSENFKEVINDILSIKWNLENDTAKQYKYINFGEVFQ